MHLIPLLKSTKGAKMPQEIQTKTGIVFKTLPDEKLRQNDQELLVILYSILSVEHKNLVKSLLSQEYTDYIEKKVEKLKAKRSGFSINLSD